MKELLEYILKNIVNNPDEVSIEEKQDESDESFVTFLINAATEDKGIIIGKKGHTISSIRDVLSIKAIQENKKVRLEIVD